MIHHYKLIVQYKGTRYLGWQIQAEGAGSTIQGEMNRALKIISKSDQVRTLGAGRTDSGVHALGQVVKASIELMIIPEKLQRALNVHLPDDIKVIHAELSDADFMPTVHAKSKEYHYRFTCNYSAAALQSDLIQNHQFELDVAKMREACKIFVGKHDFTNFYCEGTEVSSNIREIYECELLEVPQSEWMLPSHYVFRIIGNGFLKQMVRLMMGAVWNVGRGKITLEELQNSLGPTKLPKLGMTAPPNGLYMVRVNY